MNSLRKWLTAATPDENKRMAKLAGTTSDTLRQIAFAYRTNGVVRATAETAAKIEAAVIKVHRRGLPVVKCEDLCPACRACFALMKKRKDSK